MPNGLIGIIFSIFVQNKAGEIFYTPFIYGFISICQGAKD